jgi:hypothetical protein
VADLADYLDLTIGQAREQFRALLLRRPVQSGRQVTFLPVETLLCLAASFLINHRHFGGSNWAYVIAPDRIGTLLTLLGGHVGDEVLDLLAAYHDQHGRQINDLLRSSQVAATFNNWHRYHPPAKERGIHSRRTPTKFPF